MIEISENSMVEFTKLLIELSGAYEVLTDRTIMSTVEKKQCAVDVAGNKQAPLKIFKEGDGRDNYAYLQPFKESCTNSSSRGWFYQVITFNISIILKRLIQKAVELTVNKTSTDPDQMEVLNKIIDLVDEKTIAEVNRLRHDEIVYSYYNKKTKRAILRPLITTSDLRDKYKSFRKNTWMALEILVSTFFDEEDLDDEDGIIGFTATLLNIPETEAKLHVVITAAMRLGPWAKIFLDKDLHEGELQEHLKLLTGYNKLHLYLNADNTMPAPVVNSTPVVNPIMAPGSNMLSLETTTPTQKVVEPKKTNKAPSSFTVPGATTEKFTPFRQSMAPQFQPPPVAPAPVLGQQMPIQQQYPPAQQYPTPPPLESSYPQAPSIYPTPVTMPQQSVYGGGYGGYHQPQYGYQQPMSVYQQPQMGYMPPPPPIYGQQSVYSNPNPNRNIYGG